MKIIFNSADMRVLQCVTVRKSATWEKLDSYTLKMFYLQNDLVLVCQDADVIYGNRRVVRLGGGMCVLSGFYVLSMKKDLIGSERDALVFANSPLYLYCESETGSPGDHACKDGLRIGFRTFGFILSIPS